MSDLPVSQECLEGIGGELWSSIRPDDVGHPDSAEYLANSGDELGGGSVRAEISHEQPSGESVYSDEVLATSMVGEVHVQLLEGSGSGFSPQHRLLLLGR